MRRGFKAEAERLATQVRVEAGMGKHDPLDVELLATQVGATLRSADELTARSNLERLEQLQPGALSACTFEVGERIVIVTNPLSTAERRRSDICHEIAHLLLKHEAKEVEKVGGMSFFSCDSEEEQEATWLAGCLLLPRELLLQSLRAGMDVATVAAANEVSIQMTNFRIRTTGIQRQLAARS